MSILIRTIALATLLLVAEAHAQFNNHARPTVAQSVVAGTTNILLVNTGVAILVNTGVKLLVQ